MARRRVSTSTVLAVDLDVTGVAELPELTRQAILLGMRRGMNRIRQLARANASGGVVQRRTGKLAGGVRAQTVRRGDDVIGRVWAPTFYGRMLEYGTQPHVIQPRTKWRIGKRPAKALAAGDRFWARVKHPGVKPRPWFRPAVEQGLPEVARMIDQEILTMVARETGRG